MSSLDVVALPGSFSPALHPIPLISALSQGCWQVTFDPIQHMSFLDIASVKENMILHHLHQLNCSQSVPTKESDCK